MRTARPAAGQRMRDGRAETSAASAVSGERGRRCAVLGLERCTPPCRPVWADKSGQPKTGGKKEAAAAAVCGVKECTVGR